VGPELNRKLKVQVSDLPAVRKAQRYKGPPDGGTMLKNGQMPETKKQKIKIDN